MFFQQFGPRIKDTFSAILSVVFLGLWCSIVLKAFGISQEVRALVSEFLDFGVDIGTFPLTVKGIVLFVGFLALGLFASRTSQAVIEEEVFSRYNPDRGIRHAVTTAVHYVILLIAATFALGGLGIDIKNLVILAGAISVGAGFGLQTIVNNLVSGIIVLAERPIRIGDLIGVNGVTGTVTKITMRSTTLRTGDDAEIIVPNSKLVSDQLINWTLSSAHGRVTAKVGVAYGADIDRCMKALREAAASVSEILQHPRADVFFLGFGERTLEFQVGGWISDVTKKFPTESDLHLAIARKLDEYGIKLRQPYEIIKMPELKAPEQKAE